MTQCYIDNPDAVIHPGAPSNDAYTLEHVYEAVNKLTVAALKKEAEKGEPVPLKLVELNNALDNLRRSAKHGARNNATDSPEERLKTQKEAAESCRIAMERFMEYEIKPPEGKDLQDEKSQEQQSLYEGYMLAKERFLGMEAKTGSAIIKNSGPTKSAAKWIDDFKAQIPKKGPVDADTVAMILASRQLSQAVFGKRGNIDRTKLSEMQVRQQAELLKDSPEFKKFMQENPNIDPAILKGNHGGKLEQTYEKFLAKEGKEKLEYDIGGRYRRAIQDPAFKLMAMGKDTVDMLCKGDEEGFRKEFEDFTRACRGPYNSFSGKFEPKVNPKLSLDRLKEAAKEDPALKKIVDGYTDLQQSTLQEGGKTEQKVAKVMNDLVEYQNKNAAAQGSTALAVNDTLRLLNATVKGTYLENQILDQQIGKINEARGLQPGQPEFISKESLAKEPALAGKPAEAQQEVQVL